ncbi:MAG: M56 family metallopeptidase [Lachnospiraceae bacterium]|nr:M56 family metallopeptidase [Lachnospiraceae bacterium]MDD7668631.1 M56 family metallopeptidase [Lachnospiraceae bacterium]MDY2619849.1 M56 family metallopeptidase [Agathobacter sp.]
MLNDLSQIFLTFLYKNMTVSVVIIAVLLARFLLRKMPKKYSYILWSIVGIRMIFDLPFATNISVFNLFRGFAKHTSTVETMLAGSHRTNLQGSTDLLNKTDTTGAAAAHASRSTVVEAMTHTLTTSQMVLGILGLLWLIVVALFVTYGIYSYVKCRLLVRTAVIARDITPDSHKKKNNVSVWECDRIPSPFVLGIIRSRIYIPFRMPKQEQAYILAHEECHIRRLDPLWKLIAFLLLAVYWWNPLVWIAFFYMVRDMEMSCDEAVIEQFGNEIKQGYSNSLLSFAMERHPYSFAPVAFGEGDAGRRIKNVLNFKKPHTWVAILVFVLLVVVGVSCLTNGKDKISSETVSDTENSQMQQTAVETTEAPMSSDNNSTVQESLQSVDKWAQAYAARDVRTIQDMATDDAKNELKEENLLDDNGNFGWSSPWPWFDEESGMPAYQITQSDDTSATILYYAQVSDPHVTVWKETLQYTRKDDKIEIAHEELQMLNFIASGSEFENAYPKGIQNTPMDYQANGLGETLNEHAISANGMSPDGEYNLTDPMEAAQYLLNLLRNDDKVEITADKKDKTQVELKVHFTEDDITHHITMIRPWGEDGIWVVGEIS